MKFLAAADLNGNEIRNVRAQILASDPGSPAVGQFWYDSTNNVFKYRNNATTISLGASSTDATTLNGQSGAYYRARSNHTGTQLAATISDFDTQVRTNRLDQLAPPTAAVPMNGQIHTGLGAGSANGHSLRYEQVIGVYAPLASPALTGTPTAPTASPGTNNGQVATTGYVDAAVGAAISGLDVKQSVRAATTANITLSAPQTVDGVAVIAGNRVLVKNQTAGEDNGIYVVAAGAWTRALDCDNTPGSEVTAGLYTFVEEGTTQADSGWILTTDDTIVLGTTSLSFTQFSGAGQITAGNGLSKSGNTLSAVGTASRISVGPSGIDISAAYVGQASITTLGTITTGVWNGTDIAVADGGTGASTAAAARANLSAAGKISFNVGDNSATSIVLTHNLGTRDVSVTVRDAATFEEVQVDNVATTTNTVTLTFAVAPTTDAYRATVMG